MGALSVPVLVLHDRPDELRATLAARHPGVTFAFARAPDEVLPALEAHRPEVVFSIKHSGFPGAAHRPVVSAPTVRWVQVGGSGYEHLAPWDPSRVTVTHARGVLAPFLAETAMGALLALNHKLLGYRDAQRARRWSPTRFRPLVGQTLLVVGLGAIGRHVARLARAFGMRVLAVGRRGGSDPEVDELHPLDALPALLPRADVVSVRLRAAPETAGLFDARAFAAMRPGALFLNTSRGALVDEDALRDALDAGRVGGAYLDVFRDEPLPADSVWWGRDDVLVTPHASDNAEGWPLRFAALFGDNLDRWIAGEALVNVAAP